MPAALGTEGIRIHRTGMGPPVVLLHCLGVDHRLWDATVARLKDRFTLIRYDFPGHGDSPVPAGPYRVEDLSVQLGGLLTREGIEQAHLVGISLGGLVAQHFAASAPQRVLRLVLADTTPRYTDDMRRMWAQRAGGARSEGVRSLAAGILKIWFTDDMAAANPPAVQYVKDAFARMSGEGYALACEALAAADLRPFAPKILAPTLVLCGEQDIPSFLDSARWLAANLRSARLEWLAPARHASVLEQPEAFARLLREFLAPARQGESCAGADPAVRSAARTGEASLRLEVNGHPHTFAVEPRTTLLELLRERLGLTGAKPSCERGECGACTVLLDDRPINACIVLAVQAAGRRIVTIEGLAQRPDFQPLLDAFVSRDAGQCGYCTPGFAVAAYALLRDEPGAGDASIRWGLVGHICRCCAYDGIVAAVRDAAVRMRRP